MAEGDPIIDLDEVIDVVDLDAAIDVVDVDAAIDEECYGRMLLLVCCRQSSQSLCVRVHSAWAGPSIWNFKLKFESSGGGALY